MKYLSLISNEEKDILKSLKKYSLKLNIFLKWKIVFQMIMMTNENWNQFL